MLSFLKGTIHAKHLTGGYSGKLIIDVGGVGFEATVSQRTLHGIGKDGSQVMLNTCLAVRENEWTLYGFISAQERELFTLLQSVNGVGPKVALALVSTIDARQLAQAIINGDHKQLSQAPGVGTRVAQRISLELKPKIEEWLEQQGVVVNLQDADSSKIIHEVQEILGGLGYTGTEISLALEALTGDEVSAEQDVESLVMLSLRRLNAAAR